MWVQAFHLSIDDRLTTSVTSKNIKTAYIFSGRLDKEDELIITKDNITNETRTYRDSKFKKIGFHSKNTQTISQDFGK